MPPLSSGRTPTSCWCTTSTCRTRTTTRWCPSRPAWRCGATRRSGPRRNSCLSSSPCVSPWAVCPAGPTSGPHTTRCIPFPTPRPVCLSQIFFLSLFLSLSLIFYFHYHLFSLTVLVDFLFYFLIISLLHHAYVKRTVGFVTSVPESPYRSLS